MVLAGMGWDRTGWNVAAWGGVGRDGVGWDGTGRSGIGLVGWGEECFQSTRVAHEGSCDCPATALARYCSVPLAVPLQSSSLLQHKMRVLDAPERCGLRMGTNCTELKRESRSHRCGCTPAPNAVCDACELRRCMEACFLLPTATAPMRVSGCACHVKSKTLLHAPASWPGTAHVHAMIPVPDPSLCSSGVPTLRCYLRIH